MPSAAGSLLYLLSKIRFQLPGTTFLKEKEYPKGLLWKFMYQHFLNSVASSRTFVIKHLLLKKVILKTKHLLL